MKYLLLHVGLLIFGKVFRLITSVFFVFCRVLHFQHKSNQ
jgi:hypothetical protein